MHEMLERLGLALLVGFLALFDYVMDLLNGHGLAPVLCWLVLVGWVVGHSLGLTDLNTSTVTARSSTDYLHNYSLIIPLLSSG